MATYGILPNQVYLAADGSHCGQLVLDTTTYAERGDVLAQPFTADGCTGMPQRIDAFKLARVRYSLMKTRPDWLVPVVPTLNAVRESFGLIET